MAMKRKVFTTDKVAAPVGPFSPAATGGGAIYLSGQTAQDPSTGRLLPGDVTLQTEQIFRNLAAVLASAGKTFDDVVKVSVFLTDMKDFGAMNAVYGRYFAPPYPARTTVGVAALPLGASVEIDLVAS
jgi:2-iminobutanoate/2-iminopropanoate deaminase